MTDNRFRRRYILMEQPDPAYAASGGLKGLARIETRGNRGLMRLSIQNLRSSVQPGAYQVLLFGQEEDHTFSVKMGVLVEDTPGCFSYLGSFNACDMDGRGRAFSDFHSILIAACSPEGETVSVLRGHLKKTAPPITYEMLNPDPLWKKLQSYMLETEESLSLREVVWPFEENLQKYQWWRMENTQNFPLSGDDRFAPLYLLTVRYRHFLFGLPLHSAFPENKQISENGFWLLAIPGKSSESEELRTPHTFLWKPLRGFPFEKETDGYGYFLCAVSNSTGKLLPPEVI